MDNNKINGSRTSELYRSACDGIKAPDTLLRKVINMEGTTKLMRNTFKRVAIVMAALALAVFASNAVVYAATGQGWFGRIMVSWFGEEKEINFTEEKNINGDVYYSGNIQNENGDSFTITTKDMDALDGKSFSYDGGRITMTDEAGTSSELETYDQFEEFTAGVVQVTPLPEKTEE